jgi:hypothetical protein
MSPPHLEGARAHAFEVLGRPTDEEVITSALQLQTCDDRNDRVAALRVLGWYLHDDRVAEAVLRATHDPVRRVREIAMRLLPVRHPGASERLLAIATDDDELHKLSRLAFARLARRDLGPETMESIRDLLDAPRYRSRVLLTFLTQRVPVGADALLEHIVRVGSKQEAVAATRLLCGYLAIRKDNGFWNETLQEADIDWLFTPGTMAKARYVRYYWLPPAA